MCYGWRKWSTLSSKFTFLQAPTPAWTGAAVLTLKHTCRAPSSPYNPSFGFYCILNRLNLTVNPPSGGKHQSKSMRSLYFNRINNTTSFLWDEGRKNSFSLLVLAHHADFLTFSQWVLRGVEAEMARVLKASSCSAWGNAHDAQSNRCREYLTRVRTHSSVHRVTEPHNACTLTHNETSRVNVYRFYPSPLGREWTQWTD